MRQDNFKKCYKCHRFSEIFQCVINRRRNTKAILKTILRIEKRGQKYIKHKACEQLNCSMTKTLEEDLSEKTLSKLV